MNAKALHLSRQSRVRLGELFEAFETNRDIGSVAVISSRARFLGPPLDSLGKAATRIVRRRFGEDLAIGHRDLKAFCLSAAALQVSYLVMGVFAYLSDLETIGGVQRETAHRFAEEVNDIVLADGFPLFFAEEKCGWTARISSDAEAIRRALLDNPSDVAVCKQNDPQVEMVVSTVQSALTRANPVLVDYGAGLGRVLLGFGTARRFRNAVYVAVDEPVSEDVKALAKIVGAKFVSASRETFLKRPTKADVIILMNTLHHIPFNDVPRQIGKLLAALKPDGMLVIQEIGELRQPEQLNVPWRIEDIIALFDVPGCVSNPRSATTRTHQVPLTHMIVHIDGTPPIEESLSEACRIIWKRMKSRALDELRELYAARDPDNHLMLQHVLMTNANLDLNKPE